MRDGRSGLGGRAIRAIVSVPIFVKTLGIGAIVAVIFGGVILLQARESLSRNLNQLLKERTLVEAHALALSLARPMTTNDVVGIDEILRRTRRMYPDVEYLIVRDPRGKAVCHTFENGLPADLSGMPAYRVFSEERFRIVDTGANGRVFEAVRPMGEGQIGYVQVGIGDRLVGRETAALTSSIFWGLGISVTLGVSLALILTYILIRPVLHLKDASDRIRKGDFQARAEIFSADEIGDLAVSFNDMARSLQRYRAEVEEKEKARVALIERIVRSQEEERKLISRELHDHFGQSLLAVLVGVQSSRGFDSLSEPVREQLKREIGGLIDDLRRIVRGMRPAVLDDYGLDSALENYVEEVKERFGLKITYKYNRPEGVKRLPSHVEVALYRIAQEALANVVRHSGAEHASVVVLQSSGDLLLLVEDDGRGFDPSLIEKERSMGIIGMRERVSLLGGAFDIESAVGEGTTLRVRIPNKGAS